MRQSVTAVLERLKDVSGSFATEPYEVAWASEAIFFVRTERHGAEVGSLRSKVQLSADGIDWVDEGSAMLNERSGTSFVKVRHFGGWLRLVGEFENEAASARVTIQLVLKE